MATQTLIYVKSNCSFYKYSVGSWTAEDEVNYQQLLQIVVAVKCLSLRQPTLEWHGFQQAQVGVQVVPNLDSLEGSVAVMLGDGDNLQGAIRGVSAGSCWVLLMEVSQKNQLE